MILVTVGTTHYKFNRLASAINKLTEHRREKVIIQSGFTESFIKRKNVSIFKFISMEKLMLLTIKARLIISHAGEASIIQYLKHPGIPFIIVPRDAKFKEHVDNQQIEIARSIKNMGIGIVVDEPERLTAIVDNLPRLRKRKRTPTTHEPKILISFLTLAVENTLLSQGDRQRVSKGIGET